MNHQLVLASKSPRRQELLTQLGFTFDCLPADIDESVRQNESPNDYVDRLAREKSQCIAQQVNANCVVLGSDTSVIIGDKILGKPRDLTDCIQMLTELSGQKHQVITGVAVTNQAETLSTLVTTDVYFKRLTQDEITRYWQSGEPCDKAGGYGIQGVGGQFVKRIEGSYSAVVGLPLYETAQLLAKYQLPMLNYATLGM